MKKLYTLLILLFAVSFTIGCLGCAGCQSRPDREDYTNTSCYLFAECLYRNAENPDKSICAPFAQECRAYDRFEFCKNPANLPERIDFDKCMLLLNQK